MERIRQLRNEKGLSQAKLAVMADMDPATLNRIEQGKANPNLKTIEKVAAALGVEVVDLFPKVQSPLPEAEQGRRESKLPEVAELLLEFGEMLLLTWAAELPERARANDDEWLANIAVMWRTFGLINYGVLHELGADGVRDMEGWFARYMDVNAAVHRINAAIQEHSAAGAAPDEEAAVLLEPLAVA